MKTNLLRGALVIAVVGTVASCSNCVEATQYKKVVNGKEVVVHTNPIPVVLHRLVPPQHGRHVTARELNQGSVPNSGRVLGQRRK